MVDTGITMDLAQLVLDDEMAAMIEKTVAGIAVSDETLMLDEIHAVGSWSDYLARELTLTHMRDFSQPQLFERRVYDAWLADGATTAYERARSKAKAILAEHEVEPLDPDLQQEIDAILAAAEQSLGVRRPRPDGRGRTTGLRNEGDGPSQAMETEHDHVAKLGRKSLSTIAEVKMRCPTPTTRGPCESCPRASAPTTGTRRRQCTGLQRVVPVCTTSMEMSTSTTYWGSGRTFSDMRRNLSSVPWLIHSATVSSTADNTFGSSSLPSCSVKWSLARNECGFS